MGGIKTAAFKSGVIKAILRGHPEVVADWANYRSARNKAVSILRSAKREFYNNSFENNKNNARAIWKSIKTLTGPKRNTPEISRLKIDGYDVDDPLEMANHFNSYFSTIADKSRDTISCSPSDLSKLINFVESRKDPIDLFSVPDISSAQVYTMIMKIGPHKLRASTRSVLVFYALLLLVIAPSAAKLINLSFSTCKYPTRWKTVKVTPLFKSGARYDPCNYRPISVLPVLSKVIERHLHNCLYTFLNDHNRVDFHIPDQNGGRQKNHCYSD